MHHYQKIIIIIMHIQNYVRINFHTTIHHFNSKTCKCQSSPRATIERFLTTTPWLSPRYGVDNFICYRQMHSTKDRYIAMSLSVPLNRQENGVKTQKSEKNVCLLDGWPIRKLALWVLNVRFSFLIVPARSASSNWQTTQLNLFVQMVTDSPADVTIH